MQAGKRYRFIHTLRWTRKYIFWFIVIDTIPVVLYEVFHLYWLHIPWQPISLIGIAVAFYLGFKNNSSYERLWEARKIWGGIVNASRSFTVMARDFVNNDQAIEKRSEDELKSIRKSIVHRHVAWLHALTYELRKVKPWEHDSEQENEMRKSMGVDFHPEKFENLKKYLSQTDYDYMMSKGNKSSHLVSLQSRNLIKLRQEGIIEHFRHLEMQGLLTEFYTLQGKSERIKNFPFPRQYASVNYYFVVLFTILLPFGMMDVFTTSEHDPLIWLSIPFTVVCTWVFWMMELIGEYSENPFEGLYNDVPISSMAVGIEKDIRQMLDETDLPEAVQPEENMQLLF